MPTKNYSKAEFEKLYAADANDLCVLLSEKTNIFVDGNPLTVYLVKSGNRELLELIYQVFEGLPDVDAKDPLGEVALYWAIKMNDYKTIELLLNAQANAFALPSEEPSESDCVAKYMQECRYLFGIPLMPLEMVKQDQKLKMLFENQGYDFKKYKVKDKENSAEIRHEIKKLLSATSDKNFLHLVDKSSDEIDTIIIKLS